MGKETIIQLAKHNPSAIYLAARSQQKAEATISEIKTTVPATKSNIVYIPMDMSSFSSIKEGVSIFTSQSERLDILYNNAGIMAGPMSKSPDGYEIQFATNHIGHQLLTDLLLLTLLRTAERSDSDVRILNIASSAHRMAPEGGIILDKDALSQQTPWKRYGQSKLANILHAKELARRYPSITAVAIDPGRIETDLWNANKKINFVSRVGVNVFGKFWLKDVHEGAKNQLWAATAKGVKSGSFYEPVGKAAPGARKEVQDEKSAKRLYDWTEEELRKHI